MFHFPLKEMKNLIFSFIRVSGVESKHGDEFRHFTRNAYRIWPKVGNKVFLRGSLLPLLTLLYVGYFYLIFEMVELPLR